MLIITPNLHYNGQCRQAMELYKKAFGAETTVFIYNSQADARDYCSSSNMKNKVYHAEMLINGQRIMMSDTDSLVVNGHPISLVVTFNNQQDVMKAYDIISDGAIIISPVQKTTYSSCFVSLVDKFGIRWELMTEQPDI